MASLTGSFLIAKQTLDDPNFRETVILLLQHDDNGAVGLVLNRPTKSNKLPFPVFTGGPCPAQGFLLLHGHPEWIDDVPEKSSESNSTEVAPGIYLGTHSCLMKAMNEEQAEPLRLRLFRGYAGWGPQQLEGELAQGAWGIMRANGDFLFETPTDEIWDCLAPPPIPEPSLN